MSYPHVKYLLIGGGVASSAAAEAIRARDAAGSILLVGQEINGPYHRPPLSKEYLRRQKPRVELFATPPDWFEKNGVSLRTGRQVSHLDASRMSVTLDTGEEISFDQLLLATGGSPARLNVPGAELPNVFYLRSLPDAEAIQKAIDKARIEGFPHANGRGRAAVVGGGFLGVEVAASLAACGISVALLLMADHPWEKFAGETTGRLIADYLRQHGIDVLLRSPPQRIEGDGRVQRVVTADSVVETDFAVVAVGMNVNRELLRGTPIAAERAILTDDHCRTNLPGVFAAGDCAAIFDPLFGKHRILDHWDHARITGALAGRNMAGANEAYSAVNYFFSDVFDLSLSGWGESRLVERRLIRGTPHLDSPDFIEIGIGADGRIVQILAVGHRGEDELLRDLIARRVHVNGNEELIKDPGCPLAMLFK